MLKLITLCIVLLVTAATTTLAGQTKPRKTVKCPIITISGPTIIGFFSASQSEIDNDPGTSDALDDFQFHLRQAKQQLQKSGIVVHEVYAGKFQVVLGAKKETFTVRRDGVGYYFVKPGKAHKVVYDVMDHSSMVDTAKEYFKLP